jgi:hypothetical protein
MLARQCTMPIDGVRWQQAVLGKAEDAEAFR